MDDSPRFGWEEDPDAETKPWNDWPRCPRCGTRRDTACPDCAVPGVEFALAELDPAAALPVPPDGASDGAIDGAEGCRSVRTSCCGGGQFRASCSTHGSAPDNEESTAADGADAVVPSAELLGGPAVMLVCPICDEAFPPKFFRRCRHCEHDFGSGLELDSSEESAANYRVLFTLLGVLAAMAGIAVYLLFLFRE